MFRLRNVLKRCPRLPNHTLHILRYSPAGRAESRGLAFLQSKQPKQDANAHVVVKERLSHISELLADIHRLADWQALRSNIADLESKLEVDGIWTADAKKALALQSQLNYLNKKLSVYEDLRTTASEMTELAALAIDGSDLQMQEELIPELDTLLAKADEYLVSLWLSEPTDANSAYIEIHPGSGGTEACDWAAMLARMYTKWAHSREYSVEVVEESPGDVAGINSTTLLVNGPYAYGYAQFESGVHRLVRFSPFDQAHARHTSFASVRVSPHFEENAEVAGVELNPSDLKITTMRSQGAGGQHVNKTESAVRVVHVPTGLVVSCQQERSQHKNKALALSLLKSKLYDIELRKRAQSKVDAYNVLPDIAWGSQIRSYVLQPYQLIKDSRTGHEVGSGGVQRVLDGDLDEFVTPSTVFIKF